VDGGGDQQHAAPATGGQFGVQVAAVVRGVSKVIADIGCGIGDANGDVVIR
jgi:hypothetical protein